MLNCCKLYYFYFIRADLCLQDEGGKLQTVVPVLSLADFADAAGAAQHAKAVMLAYPRTNAIIIREAGILCWGLMSHAQVEASAGPQKTGRETP